MKRLENKVAIIYGDGAVGAATAKAFACEGASVFLTGRTPAKLDAIAREVAANGGTIETAIVDALDEQAVEKHISDTVSKSGKIDISFNAIGLSRKRIQSTLLTDLSVESFSLPIITYATSHFITAKAAARRMVKQGNGVIIMHTPNASRVSPPFAGGGPSAWSAMEALCRSLSVECGKQGVRTVCLLTTGIPETPLIREVWENRSKAYGIPVEQFHATAEGMTHRGRLNTLKELTAAAVFVASDEGSAITGTIFNLTAGMIAD